MTDTEATAPKPEKTPEQEAQRQATRVLAKALSRIEDGTPEEKKARLTDNKAKYSGDARKLIKALTKEGIAFSVNEAASTKAKRAARKAVKGEAGETAED